MGPTRALSSNNFKAFRENVPLFNGITFHPTERKTIPMITEKRNSF